MSKMGFQVDIQHSSRSHFATRNIIL